MISDNRIYKTRVPRRYPPTHLLGVNTSNDAVTSAGLGTKLQPTTQTLVFKSPGMEVQSSLNKPGASHILRLRPQEPNSKHMIPKYSQPWRSGILLR